MKHPTLTDPLTPPSHYPPRFMQRHLSFCLCCYFLMTFVMTWLYLLLVAGPLHLTFPLVFLGSFLGPTAAAFLFTALSDGRAGVLRLLRSYVRWRVGLSWYLLALLGLPALALLGFVVTPGAFAAFRAPSPSFALGYLVSYPAMFLFGGPLAEEVGWRGFALPRLQQRLRPGSLLPFAEFTLLATALSVILTWVFNHTRGSLLLTMLGHTSFNTAASLTLPLFASLSIPAALPGFDLIFGTVALLLILATRGHLGYQRTLHGTLPSASEKGAAQASVAAGKTE